MSREGELRATSDLMLDLVDRLRIVEEAKRSLAPGSPEFAKTAWEVAELARLASRWAELQLRQANEFAASGADQESPALRALPKRRLDEVLAEWRQAELRLAQALPDSPDARAAASAAERLRAEYRELQAQKLADRGRD